MKRCNPADRRDRHATWDETEHPAGRWRSYDFADLVARDKASLDVFWLKDDAMEASLAARAEAAGGMVE